MAERTDATLLDLVGSASLTGAVEVIGGERDTQTLVDVVDATTDVLEEDDDNDSVFYNRETALPGICKEGMRGADLISCPLMASLVLGPNDADTSEAVTKPARNPSPLESEDPLGASYGSADPLSDQSRAVQSEDKGTPLNLMESEPQTEPQEGSCLPTAQNPGGTEIKSSAGSSGLELDRKKGRDEVTSVSQMAQEVTPLAASVPVLEKEEGQVNGDEKAPAEGPSEELMSESQDELEEDEEGEEEEVTEGVQQESSSEGSQSSQGASPRCSVQSSGEMSPGGSQKSSTSRHSNSKYNTVSYRKIRKGNTKQRIDEFESMMHL
ncbi:ermin-like [Anguilla anguilla]|uniref:ermin-like n=1 Tax=Anguilla anguilla TaxID=7936 RepID=UPI0015A7BE24|nr:ermin-like [Anguilla anguilla]